ncbi:MAG: FecR family protein [Actinomycetota bacterium]
MTEVHREESEDRLFEQASAWFARLGADDVTERELRRFEQWLARGPAHARAWQEVQTLYAALGEPARRVSLRVPSHSSAPSRPPTPALRPRRRAARPWAVAAALLLMVLVAATWGPEVVQDLASDYHTATGEQRRVILADGSRVHLNTNTAVALDGPARRVTLLRGEAFFEVASRPGTSFSVDAGPVRTRVTGTAFSVMRGAAEVAVTVTEGRVEVIPDDQGGASVSVTGGQAIRFRAGRFSAVEPADPKGTLAWRDGRVVFVQEPLAKVIDEVNRYRPGRIVIFDPEIRNRPVTGVFAIDRLDLFLETLEHGLGVQVVSWTDYLVVLR